eukprot:10886058-Alexandrium_andersonii.AAC.1
MDEGRPGAVQVVQSVSQTDVASHEVHIALFGAVEARQPPPPVGEGHAPRQGRSRQAHARP